MARLMQPLDPAPEVSIDEGPYRLTATEAGRFAHGLRATVQLWKQHELLDPTCTLNMGDRDERADFGIAASAESGLRSAVIEKALLALMVAIEGLLRYEPEPLAQARRPVAEISPLEDRFRVDDQGVWYDLSPTLADPEPEPLWVCARLDIVAATRDEDDDNHGHLLQFRDRHGQPQEWAMPLELLEEQKEYRKVLRRRGLKMNYRARRELHDYLEVTHAEARARCVLRVGWHHGAYVLPDGPIGDTGGEHLILQTMDARSEGYRQAGTMESWREEVARLCAGNSRLLLAVSAAFAAPLLKLTHTEGGGVHLRGTSSEGKTTSIYVAASVWGERQRVERWRATANGLEGVALAHNDNLLCLDELREIDPHEAGNVAYMLANGAGKRRGQPPTAPRPPRLTWQLLFLSTGEISLEEHMRAAGERVMAGQEVRLADLPADAGRGVGVFEDLHGLQTGKAFADHLSTMTQAHYGHAGRAFVQVLTENQATYLAKVEQVRQVFLKTYLPPSASGQVGRVAWRFALIGAAGELATALEVTGWPHGEALEAAGRCFVDWLTARGALGPSDEARALAQVRLFFERYGASRFAPWTLGKEKSCQRCKGTGHVAYSHLQGICFTCHGAGQITADHPAMRLIHSRAGWSKATDDGRTEYFVLPEVFRAEVCQGFDVAMVCQALGSRGYLMRGSGTRWVRWEHLPGLGQEYVYRVTADLLGAPDDKAAGTPAG